MPEKGAGQGEEKVRVDIKQGSTLNYGGQPDEWSDKNEDTKEVHRYHVKKQKGIRYDGIPIGSLVGFNLLVDDVLIMASKKVYRKWARYVLWYVYTQAELITNLSKNELYGLAKVEYNGQMLERRALVLGRRRNEKEKKREVQNDKDSVQWINTEAEQD